MNLPDKFNFTVPKGPCPEKVYSAKFRPDTSDYLISFEVDANLKDTTIYSTAFLLWCINAGDWQIVKEDTAEQATESDFSIAIKNAISTCGDIIRAEQVKIRVLKGLLK